MPEEKEVAGRIAEADASASDTLSPSPKSTGPRTREGKDRSRYNAVKHGIFSKVVVEKGDPRAPFEELLGGLLNDLQPQGRLEEILVEKLAVLLWRYRRALIADANHSEEYQDMDLIRWQSDHQLRYEASIERAFDRTLTQLERLQRMRLGQSVPAPIKLDITSHGDK